MDRQERIEKEGLKEKPITFYHPNGVFGWMSNFSEHPVLMENPLARDYRLRAVEYMTTEHRFQAMKAMDYNDHIYVVQADTPGEAKKRGREIKLRDGWGDSYGDLCWYVMVECLFAKVEQNKGLLKKLMDTGYKDIWEDSPNDDIWGIRFEQDYRGKNLLGRAWMYVRNTYSHRLLHPHG